jgi:hypothetical protein
MRFKGRYIIECEVAFDANSSAEANTVLHEHIATIKGARSTKVLGVIRADMSWPDDAEYSRPPRNTPPSGSPGTPTARLEEQPVSAVAA